MLKDSSLCSKYHKTTSFLEESFPKRSTLFSLGFIYALIYLAQKRMLLFLLLLRCPVNAKCNLCSWLLKGDDKRKLRMVSYGPVISTSQGEHYNSSCFPTGSRACGLFIHPMCFFQHLDILQSPLGNVAMLLRKNKITTKKLL